MRRIRAIKTLSCRCETATVVHQGGRPNSFLNASATVGKQVSVTDPAEFRKAGPTNRNLAIGFYRGCFATAEDSVANLHYK